MKLSLAVVAALAAGVSATPIRIIEWTDSQGNTFTPEFAEPRPARISKFNNGVAPWINENLKEMANKPKQPCHKMMKGMKKPSRPSSFLPGPIGSLLSSLGLRNEEPPHPSENSNINLQFGEDGQLHELKTVHFSPDEPLHEQEKGDLMIMEVWHDQVEKMVHDVEENVLPYLQGGMVKILPVMDEEGKTFASESEMNRKQKDHHHKHHSHHHYDSEEDDDMKIKQWDAVVMDGKNGVKAHHHKHHHSTHHMHHGEAKTFAWRLNRAIPELKPTEALMFACVCGAGIGSMLHFVYMIFLLGYRKYRGVKLEKRRKARIATKKDKLLKEGKPAFLAHMCGRDRERAEKQWNEKQAAKAQAKPQSQQVQDQAEGEVVPNTEEGEQARLVVDADKV